MAEDEGNEAIVQTILILAGHLGMNVIAEGIETNTDKDTFFQNP